MRRHEMRQMHERPPWFAWALLILALFAVSSAGAVFRTMTDVPPILKAAWRLQATAIVLLPGFIIQWRGASAEVKEWGKSRGTIVLLGLSGVFLWLHFASWVWSLDHTSLTHSLLFVTSHPLVVVIFTYAIGRRLSRLEIAGAVIGFSGAIIALQEVRNSGEVTFIGDLAAFFGAVMVVGYLMIGRRLRSEGLPLHLYAFPVTVVAAILLTFSSMLFEASPIGMAAADLSTFGWLDAAWLLPIAYLAIGPGFVGHTGINAALRWLPTLLISVTLVMEPMLGAIIGWALGVEEIPGMWTWLGGPLMVAGTVMVTVAVARKTAPPSEAE